MDFAPVWVCVLARVVTSHSSAVPLFYGLNALGGVVGDGAELEVANHGSDPRQLCLQNLFTAHTPPTSASSAN